MPVNRNEYVVVNIWPSKKNMALKGANVGHVSLSIFDGETETYVSLWPIGYKPSSSRFFDAVGEVFPDFVMRPAHYKQNYEKDCIAEASHERQFRDISNINECKEGEIPYCFNRLTHETVRLTTQPRGLKEEEYLRAYQLLHASFRVVLFSLDVDKIKLEFEKLKNPDYIQGWSMAGSNFFTRNLNHTGQTAENCASIVYRCLNAGGLYNNIGSKHSAPLSSAVEPDDLIRMIVAVKIAEQELYTHPSQNWEMPEIETPICDIITAYKAVGGNANAANDIIPSSKPSSVSCSIM
ncbi:MAG: hypothetical protein ACRC0M_01555 [Legionella sp.]